MKNYLSKLRPLFFGRAFRNMEGPPTEPENWVCPKCGRLSSGDKCSYCGYSV